MKGKKIIIAVTASIAAYKVAHLVRILKKEEAEVKVIMTPSASDFITPLTLSVLSENPVLSSFTNESGLWNNHVDLALWADLIVVAPASANTISKMANGACDNLLLAVYLSARSKVLFAPAMDLDMYQHPATKANIEKLIAHGNVMIKPGVGPLASGLSGEGRMAEPELITEYIKLHLNEGFLNGKKAVVTAGPTFEAIDPIRFVGNHSSGKMGMAIAEELALNGAEVTLVMGPSSLNTLSPTIKRIDVTSAEEMYAEVDKVYSLSDIAVFSAAVADYSPKLRASQKIKKKEDSFNLELQKTKDILLHAGKSKARHQVVVGFAMETENEEANAVKKVIDKNADFIVLNSVNNNNKAFRSDLNEVSFVNNKGIFKSFTKKSKKEIASDIVNEIIAINKRVV